MDIPPKNQFVSLENLELFIEKYPEDTDKWLEFLDERRHDTNITTYPYKTRTIRLEDINKENLQEQTEILKESEHPISHFSEGCLLCKKSWTQTAEVPTITLICGHKFHTMCFMYNHYHTDRTHCIIDTCDINTWDYIRQIDKIKRENTESAENILFNSITRRKDFKQDFNDLKKIISDVTKKHTVVNNSLKQARNELLHKHIFSINEIQKDMNEMVKTIKENEEMNIYKNSLKIYRKKARNMFRKYHLSLRDLIRRKKLKVPWRLRWTLERHRDAFSFSNLRLRMYPGRKIWVDPLTDNNEDSDVSSEEEI